MDVVVVVVDVGSFLVVVVANCDDEPAVVAEVLPVLSCVSEVDEFGTDVVDVGGDSDISTSDGSLEPPQPTNTPANKQTTINKDSVLLICFICVHPKSYVTFNNAFSMH